MNFFVVFGLIAVVCAIVYVYTKTTAKDTKSVVAPTPVVTEPAPTLPPTVVVPITPEPVVVAPEPVVVAPPTYVAGKIVRLTFGTAVPYFTEIKVYDTTGTNIASKGTVTKTSSGSLVARTTGEDIASLFDDNTIPTSRLAVTHSGPFSQVLLEFAESVQIAKITAEHAWSISESEINTFSRATGAYFEILTDSTTPVWKSAPISGSAAAYEYEPIKSTSPTMYKWALQDPIGFVMPTGESIAARTIRFDNNCFIGFAELTVTSGGALVPLTEFNVREYGAAPASANTGVSKMFDNTIDTYYGSGTCPGGLNQGFTIIDLGSEIPIDNITAVMRFADTRLTGTPQTLAGRSEGLRVTLSDTNGNVVWSSVGVTKANTSANAFKFIPRSSNNGTEPTGMTIGLVNI